MDKISRDLELEKAIDAYVKGKLSEQDAQDLWSKLLERPDYIELLEVELGVKSILEKRGSSESARAKEKALIYKLKDYSKWAAAASVIFIMIVAINIMHDKGSYTIQSLRLNEINLAQNLITTPVTRSQNIHLGPADSLLNIGFHAAIKGDIDRALELYKEVTALGKSELSVLRAHLNIGIIEYNAKNFETAIASFKEVLQAGSKHPFINEKAYWYLGNAYINQDKLGLAQKSIQNVVVIGGVYHSPASRLIQKLNQKIEQDEIINN